jgi:hypothetical protein
LALNSAKSASHSASPTSTIVAHSRSTARDAIRRQSFAFVAAGEPSRRRQQSPPSRLLDIASIHAPASSNARTNACISSSRTRFLALAVVDASFASSRDGRSSSSRSRVDFVTDLRALALAVAAFARSRSRVGVFATSRSAPAGIGSRRARANDDQKLLLRYNRQSRRARANERALACSHR